MHKICDILAEYGLPGGKGYWYTVEAIELYEPGDNVNGVYARIAARHGASVGSVARCVSLCVGGAAAYDVPSPKELIARIKERILLENNE